EVAALKEVLEHFHHHRIKLNSGASTQFADDGLDVHDISIRASRAHGVKRVGDANHPERERKFTPLEAVWVSTAIQLFVVVADEHKHTLREHERLTDLVSDDGVGLHALELLVREATRLVE